MDSLMRIKARTRCKNRKRIGLFLVIAAMMTAFILTTGSAFSAGESADTIQIVVRQGDTLWDIAREHTGGRDLRRVVWEMRKMNELDDVFIQPGQVLLVPKT